MLLAEKRLPFAALLWAATVLLVSGLLVLYSFASESLINEAIDAEGRHNELLAQAIMEYTEGVVSHADAIAAYLQREVLALDRMRLGSFVHATQFAEVGILQVSFTDARGAVLWSSLHNSPGISIAEREYFKVHINSKADVAFLSEPVLGKVSKTTSIQLSRRLERPDGRFAGVVVVSIDPEFFAQRYENLPLDGSARITVASKQTGIILARANVESRGSGSIHNEFGVGSSFAGTPVFQDAIKEQAGHRAGRNVTTRIATVYGWHQSYRYPLLTTVATNQSDATANAMHAIRQLRWAIAVLIVFLLAGAGVGNQVINIYHASFKRLRMARATADAADVFKSDFITGVSHELRGPLTNINGFAELIATQELDAVTIKDFAGTIQRAGGHLERIVTQLLDVEKTDAGKVVLHAEPFDLREMFELAVKIHAPAAHRKNNVLELRFETAMPGKVMLDGIRFSQVLYNLLNNAIKFTAEGRVEVTARFENDVLAVSVKDTGLGIVPRYQSGIFERFRQGDPLLTRVYGGTGIGLNLCKSIVELMGGRIWFESMVGVGSTFFVEIPLRICKDGAA